MGLMKPTASLPASRIKPITRPPQRTIPKVTGRAPIHRGPVTIVKITRGDRDPNQGLAGLIHVAKIRDNDRMSATIDNRMSLRQRNRSPRANRVDGIETNPTMS
jgi:hypothetical protein